jgi:hypothetical protein
LKARAALTTVLFVGREDGVTTDETTTDFARVRRHQTANAPRELHRLAIARAGVVIELFRRSQHWLPRRKETHLRTDA